MPDRPAYVFPEPLMTHRLSLQALSAEALDAWIFRDAEALERTARVRFPEGPDGPPLEVEELLEVRDHLRDDPTATGWWAWVVALRATGEPIGLISLAGPPEDGAVAFGYAIYPRYRDRDYAREAVECLLAWTLAQPGVDLVRAAIPAWNDESIRVVERVGMHPARVATDPDMGEIVVFERAVRREPVDAGRY